MPRYCPAMLIKDALLSNPAAAEVFERHGLACAGCLASGMETLSAVAAVHDVAVDALLGELEALHDDGEGRVEA